MFVGVNLEIRGMKCAGCSAAIRTAPEEFSGVNQATIDHIHGHGEVIYDARLSSPHEICMTIDRLGYEAEVIETR
jgi:Cu+-exporting ATPase